jgi:O-antigen ligase
MLLGGIGVALVGALLVLSRSRAAWLAVAASAVVLALPLMASRRYWRSAGIGGRFVRLSLAAVAGVALAIVIPNRLNWSSDSPYLDSARGVMDYRSGSGRGRLAQYTNSMRMALSNPLLGVGPGNWPVRYVRFAPDNDASLTDDGMTANPWPSSDWVAFVSERGVVAAGALLGVFVVLLLRACRRWNELPDGEAVLAKVALVGTITATLVVSAFDAALLLAAPAFLAWCVIGAASGVGMERHGAEVPRTRRSTRAAIVVAALVVLAVSTLRSLTQGAAIVTVGTGATRAGWIRAATLDPGSYRINLRVAELYAGRGQCTASRAYARRAAGLFPSAGEPRQLLRRCG